MVQLAF